MIKDKQIHNKRENTDISWKPRVVPAEKLNTQLFDKNMATINKRLPFLFPRLTSLTHLNSQLAKGKGGYDIEFRGQYFYGKGGRSWAADRRQDFEKRISTTRFTLEPPDTESLDEMANQTIYNILKRATNSNITFNVLPGDDDCYHCIVFGVGLGEHLKFLARQTKCRHLVLVEPNIEFIYLSLFTFDWADFIEDFIASGRMISLICEDDYEIMAGQIRDHCRVVNLAFMDGTWIFQSYPSSVMKQAREKIMNDKSFFMAGMGFLEDELDMVRNSYHNLKSGNCKYYLKPDDKHSIPAFVVAGGPSLDNDLEFLKTHQDAAIIVSCGTALRSLLYAGITPDFQVEMENVPAVTELLTNLSQKFDISGINLIASNTVDPGTRHLFETTIFYFRSTLASYPIFNQGEKSRIGLGFPTVANLGCSFAQAIGCTTLYLFGHDLGTRDPDKHHAKNAPYNAGEFEFTTVIDQPVPGNLGGIVLSEFIYQWARDTLEILFHEYPSGHVYFNCSDGVRIKGALPKLSSTIDLAPSPNKNDLVDSIVANFPDYTTAEFSKSWVERDNQGLLNDFTKEMKELISSKNKKPAAAKKKINKTGDGPAINYPLCNIDSVCQLLISQNEEISAEKHYYRGSIFLTSAAIQTYFQRVTNKRHRKKFINIAEEEFTELLHTIRDTVLEFYGTLE